MGYKNFSMQQIAKNTLEFVEKNSKDLPMPKEPEKEQNSSLKSGFFLFPAPH